MRHGANVSSARPFVVVPSGKTAIMLSGYSSMRVARVVMDDVSDVGGDLRVGTDRGYRMASSKEIRRTWLVPYTGRTNIGSKLNPIET